MSSVVYYKFKSSVKTDSVQFDGSAISVKDLKAAIKTKCCLRSTDFDLRLEDASGKEYLKDTELIPKFTSITVRRVPKQNADAHRRRLPQTAALISREKTSTQPDTSHSKVTNLAESSLPEEEKIRLMIDRSSDIYSTKNYTVRGRGTGVPPPSYVCHKCNLPGHWIYECPGIKDARGNLVDSKTVKRPTGIPQDFLVRVDPGTPGAYLDKNGRYTLPAKDAEAYSQKKKEKRAFSIEENPPYVPPQERTPSAGLLCPLCNRLLKDAVVITCCGTSYCNDCIISHCFEDGSRKCPNCGAVAEKYDTAIVENSGLRRAVTDWLRSEKSESNTIVTSAEGLPEARKVVRRVLKPKQQSIQPTDTEKEEEPEPRASEGLSTVKDQSKADVSDVKEDKEDVKPSDSSEEPSVLKTDPCELASPSRVKNNPIDPSCPPIVCNNNSEANVSCATSFGAGSVGSVLPTISSVTSQSNGATAALAYSSAVTSVATIPGVTTLAGALTSVGSTQGPLSALFQPTNPLISSANLWNPTDVPFLGGGPVSQNGFSNPYGVLSSMNPLLGLQSAGGRGVLSKEEFYRMKDQLMGSKGRRRRSRSSGNSSPSHHRDGSHRRVMRGVDVYRRRRQDRRDYEDDERGSRRRSPLRRRRSRSSSGSGTRRRVRADGGVIDDYDTWKRKKLMRQEREMRRRLSPPHRSGRSGGGRRLESPEILHALKRHETSPMDYSAERGRRNADTVDKSRMRSPFNGDSPVASTSKAPPLGGVSPQCKTFKEDASDLEQAKQVGSRESSAAVVAALDSGSRFEHREEIDERVLKKLHKEEKKRLKREKKLAKRLARAQKEVAALATTEGTPLSAEEVLVKAAELVALHEREKKAKKRSGSKRERRRSRSRRNHCRHVNADSDGDEDDDETHLEHSGLY